MYASMLTTAIIVQCHFAFCREIVQKFQYTLILDNDLFGAKEIWYPQQNELQM